MTLLDHARQLDAADRLSDMRQQFHIPTSENGEPVVYLIGNSLGLQPRRTQGYLEHELNQWKKLAGRAHFEGEFPWMPYHRFLSRPMADLVGAGEHECVMMNSLTANLHFLMASFYRPTPQRHKILMEAHAFPSDRYAVESQIRWHGYDPSTSLEVLYPRGDGAIWEESDVCDAIRGLGESLALVLWPGVQYYTGQAFDIGRIVDASHSVGAVCGFDLAHAAGNIPLSLHDDECDFAVWCTYKYLNSGPGSVGGCFVHEQYHPRADLPRLAGWWGHDPATRFQMPDTFQPMTTVEAWQVSNPPILSLAAIRASLDVFQEVGGMAPLRTKSEQLTAFLADGLAAKLGDRVRILTPSDPKGRGCQLSLEIPGTQGREIQARLEGRGIISDWRAPNVLRVAPVPLYNSFLDAARLIEALDELTQ